MDKEISKTFAIIITIIALGAVIAIGFSSLRIGLNTNNLFYVSTVKRERGLDYPFAGEYTFSLNLNF